MKRFIRKRWLGIPVVLLVAVLVLVLAAGSAFAAHTVFMGNATATVVEAITVTNTGGDGGEAFTGPSNNAVWAVSLYPGETKTLNVLVTNASSAALPISTTGTGGEGVTAGWTGPTTVPASGSITLTLTMTADADASPGARTVFFAIARG